MKTSAAVSKNCKIVPTVTVLSISQFCFSQLIKCFEIELNKIFDDTVFKFEIGYFFVLLPLIRKSLGTGTGVSQIEIDSFMGM